MATNATREHKGGGCIVLPRMGSSSALGERISLMKVEMMSVSDILDLMGLSLSLSVYNMTRNKLEATTHRVTKVWIFR